MLLRIEVLDLGGNPRVQPFGRDDRQGTNAGPRLDQRGPELIEGMSHRRDDADAGDHHPVHRAALAATRSSTARTTSSMVLNARFSDPTWAPTTPSAPAL